MVIRGFVEKGSLEQRLEEGEGLSQVDIWGKSITGRRNSKCEGPGVPRLFGEQQGS